MTIPPQGPSLFSGIRASLNAKLDRLLSRPIIAEVAVAAAGIEDEHSPSAFRSLQSAARSLQGARVDAWREDPEDGTCVVRISIDYNGRWRGCEKEIRETVSSTIESAVTFLTDKQRLLLERSPREFLELSPPPETAELVSFEAENIGGSVRVVALRLAAAPESRAHIRYIAIVPNLVQIERQLDALHRVETATDDGPLGPLRVLVGACDASRLRVQPGPETPVPSGTDDRLDEFQRECLGKAMSTPHFAIIEGPPGSGKTTVIASIIKRALSRGERVLVVSPTHVAVDNVVEKLIPRDNTGEDRLEAQTLPVRYAARGNRLSGRAGEYWVGARKQRRGATIARRVQARLTANVPFAGALFANEDTEAAAHAPISAALARIESVICGTPIGILSFDSVRNAEVGAFGLLIVDEVSKMTLSEFLAIAVKARRWVVVGDPAQLPPYNNSEENGTTLDDVMPPLVELACSVAAILERAKPAFRKNERLVVVSSDPPHAAAAIRSHLTAVMPDCASLVGLFDPVTPAFAGIVVCAPEEAVRAWDAGSAGSETRGTRQARFLVEHGTPFGRPDFASGQCLVEPRERAQASIFETAFNVYHSQPWATRSGQRLRFLGLRNGLEKYLPTAEAIAAAGGESPQGDSADRRRSMIDAIATRFAINTVSVYDWLTGIPAALFDTSPLRELASLTSPSLSNAVRPFVGVLKKQYRMHASLSRVPRELFYFEGALLDGRTDDRAGCRVVLVQVEADSAEGESNRREVDTIANLLQQLNADDASRKPRPEIMVITPYREQEARLRDMLEEVRISGANVDVCTLDRCQGREAEYVLLSLVRSRATSFFDMPKRWNVAMTRAREGFFIVGNVDAYLREAADARRDLSRHGRRAGETRPLMSLLARIIEGYERQIAATRDRRGVA